MNGFHSFFFPTTNPTNFTSRYFVFHLLMFAGQNVTEHHLRKVFPQTALFLPLTRRFHIPRLYHVSSSLLGLSYLGSLIPTHLVSRLRFSGCDQIYQCQAKWLPITYLTLVTCSAAPGGKFTFFVC